MNPSNLSHQWFRTSMAFCFLLLCSHLLSQDIIPMKALPTHRLSHIDSLALYANRSPYVALPTVNYPSTFRGISPNTIIDYDNHLNLFFKKMMDSKCGVTDDSIRVLHVGDSHIRGHFFPQATGRMLKSLFPMLSYKDMGINGATTVTFCNEEKIAEMLCEHPDIIILSFGTNESHNRGYYPSVHYDRMEELLRMIQEKMPYTPILLTTPPGSYERKRIRRRKYSYHINPRTAVAVNTILEFAKDKRLAVWDMYHIVGGEKNACNNWMNSGMMRNDHVHFFIPGYEFQGELLYQALIKAYDNFIRNKK